MKPYIHKGSKRLIGFLAVVALAGVLGCGPTYISNTQAANIKCTPYGGVQAVDVRYNTVVCKDGVARQYSPKVSK